MEAIWPLTSWEKSSRGYASIALMVRRLLGCMVAKPPETVFGNVRELQSARVSPSCFGSRASVFPLTPLYLVLAMHVAELLFTSSVSLL